MNEEGRGRSAHGWSSQMRVGSLSRIGCKAEKQGTIQKKKKSSLRRDNSWKQELFLHRRKIMTSNAGNLIKIR